jgi:hypothetical protein
VRAWLARCSTTWVPAGDEMTRLPHESRGDDGVEVYLLVLVQRGDYHCRKVAAPRTRRLVRITRLVSHWFNFSRFVLMI